MDSETHSHKINWVKLFLGGLLASVICFATDGVLHESLIHLDWLAAFDALHATPPPHSSMAFIYFGLFEMGRGFITVFIYAMMRARFGAGPKTAVMAGIVGWLAFSIMGPAQFIPLGIFSNTLWIKAGIYQLATSIISTLGGAAIYQESGG